MPLRETLKLIYRSLMMFVTVVLGGGTILAFLNATPGNGLLLVGGILAVLTLMAGSAIFKLDRQDAEAEAYRGILNEMREKIPVSVRFASSGEHGGQPVELTVREEGPVSIAIAEPDVHRVDTTMLEEAKRMAGEGASLDDICRMVDPDHDAHDLAHQHAFRNIVKAMIEQA